MVGGVLYLYGEDIVGCDSRFRVEPCLLCKRMIINAGIKSLFMPKVTVISFEVMGFLLGMILSVVGIPFSIFSNSERTSPTL